MKFDIFCEIQRAFPWRADESDGSLIFDTLDQARAADRAGFEIWWQVEHHGSPQFSYSAAPEVFLTAVAMATERLRVGHAGVLTPFKINHPLRVAERAATLDILSGGRFELGLAKSGGKEWETFGVDPDTARDEVREAMHMIPRMWTEPEFSWNSPLFHQPAREERHLSPAVIPVSLARRGGFFVEVERPAGFSARDQLQSQPRIRIELILHHARAELPR